MRAKRSRFWWSHVVSVVAVVVGGAVPAGGLGTGDFTGDIQAPRLVSFSVSPQSPDVTLADAAVTATVDMSDDMSGVEHVTVIWTNPAQTLSQTADATLTSGDSGAGRWTARFTVPRYSPPGQYSLSVWAFDRVGNKLQAGPDDLAGRGFPSALSVRDATPDTTAPAVTSVSYSPSVVDVRDGPVSLDIDVGVSDSQSSVTWVFVGLVGPDHSGDFGSPAMVLASGDARSGHWRGTATIPRYVRQGSWSLMITVRDRTHNQRAYSDTDVARLYGGFQVLSEEDLEAPQVASLTLDPPEVNVHDADQTVHVRMRLTDNLSGVRDAIVSVWDRVSGQSNATPYVPLSSGSPNDGTWESSLVIPKSSATGLRDPAVHSRDTVGNGMTLWAQDLLSLGVPPLLVYNVPLPPALLGVDPGDGSALVRWDPPTDDRGAVVTGYVVIESPGGIRTEVAGDARSVVVGGLTNGQAHTFTVLALNKAGLSDPSRAASAVPGAGAVLAGDPGAGSPTPLTPARSGYWMLDRDGTVHAFGSATHFGNAPSPSPAVDLEPTPARDGYWVVDGTGKVTARGAAAQLGSAPRLQGGEAVTSLSATPTGRGYWLFTDRGRVLPVGDAPWLGDMATTKLNGPVLDAIPTPSGRGYFMVGSDGGVFTFGDARFVGSMGGKPLNAAVRSLVPDPEGRGYWLVASDGGIFAFDAPFYGSTGSLRLNRPISGMVGSPTGHGYLMVAADGGIFAFGDVPFSGSLGASPPPSPVVAVATR